MKPLAYGRLLAGILVLLWVVPGLPGDLLAADSKDAELQRKSEEVERLKNELSRAQKDLEQLKKDNDRLRQEQAARPVQAVAKTPAKPVTPMAAMPAPGVQDVVEVHNLVGHFRADPAAAAQRYQGKSFRVTGVVTRFSTKLAIRNYDIVLESPDPSLPVVCTFAYVESDYRAVYSKESGRILVARLGETTERKLLQVGDTVVIQGHCGGLKKNKVAFGNCRVIP